MPPEPRVIGVKTPLPFPPVTDNGGFTAIARGSGSILRRFLVHFTAGRQCSSFTVVSLYGSAAPLRLRGGRCRLNQPPAVTGGGGACSRSTGPRDSSGTWTEPMRPRRRGGRELD